MVVMMVSPMAASMEILKAVMSAALMVVKMVFRKVVQVVAL